MYSGMCVCVCMQMHFNQFNDTLRRLNANDPGTLSPSLCTFSLCACLLSHTHTRAVIFAMPPALAPSFYLAQIVN